MNNAPKIEEYNMELMRKLFPTLDELIRKDIPITRENYLKIDCEPEVYDVTTWTPEAEACIPDFLQDWSMFTV